MRSARRLEMNNLDSIRSIAMSDCEGSGEASARKSGPQPQQVLETSPIKNYFSGLVEEEKQPEEEKKDPLNLDKQPEVVSNEGEEIFSIHGFSNPFNQQRS